MGRLTDAETLTIMEFRSHVVVIVAGWAGCALKLYSA